jgi:subtilisin family serine protease
MKKLFYLLMVLLLAACGSEKTANISSDTSTSMVTNSKTKITAQSVISQMEKGNYKEGELLVKFKSGVVKASSLKVHQAVGASVAKRFHIVPNLEHVKLQEGLSVKDAITQYMSDPNVEYAEPNYIRCASSIPPNDTYFNDQWALNNTGTYASGTPGADIKALDAWYISTGNPGVTIAVLDSGIDYNHQDLVGNIWRNPGETNCLDEVDNDGNGYVDDCKGWNFVDYNNDPMDDFGHGTHVAGIIGAKGDNGIGIAGVMWDVKLMPVKIYNADTTLTGSCTSIFAADEVAGIEYAVYNGAKIINASFHGEGYCNAEHDAIAVANTAKVLFVAAAGNGGDDGIGDNNDLDPVFPASYGDPKYGGLPNIISVAATDQNDQRASFSNFGPASVYVAAPGVYILSTILQDEYLDKDFNWGTSMAAPHVSGLAGLLYSYYDGIHNTQFDYSQIRATILRYVDIKPTLEGWIYTGGRINAYRALSSLLSPTSLTATAISQTQISLTWVANATGDDGYKVERKISGGSFTEIGTLPPRSSSYTDGSLTPNTTYIYKVKAYNNISESFFSNEASATTVIGGSGGGSSSGGGGSCSIGARQNPPTAIADLAVMLIPLIFVAIMRRRR